MTAYRINQFVALCANISRRKADEAISNGEVKLNGRIAKLGESVESFKDVVKYQGQILEAPRKRYLAFHKPKGVITTKSDEAGRKTIYDWLTGKDKDLLPAGRLDRNSSGLLILSNDGEFIQALIHPSKSWTKRYRVRVNLPLTEAHIKKLEKGILLTPENKTAIITVIEVSDPVTCVVETVTGYNRQLRRMMQAVGLDVVDLRRTDVGPLSIGRLGIGQVRDLKPSEIKLIMAPSQAAQKGKPKAGTRKNTSRPPQAPRKK